VADDDFERRMRAARARVRSQRAAQGLPETIEDESLLRFAAAMFADTPKKTKPKPERRHAR